MVLEKMPVVNNKFGNSKLKTKKLKKESYFSLKGTIKHKI